MAGPWEQYQTATEGPWTQYSTPSTGGVPGPRQEVSPVTQFGRGLASAADVLVGNVPSAIAQQVAYPVARLFSTPERAQEISQTVGETLAKPVGKAFGVTETPEYKSEASQRAMEFIGKNIHQGVKWLSEKTGLAEPDVANIVGSLTFAAPKVTGAVNALAPKGVVTEGIANAMANITGGLSGKPAQAYKEAYRAGKEGESSFLENLRGKTTPDELLTTVKEGIDKIRADTSASYQTAKQGWAANTTPLDFTPVDAAYQKLKDSLAVKGHAKIGSAEQKIVDEIGSVLDEWRSDPAARTALDFDALKQRIDAIYPESPTHTNAQRAVTDIRNAIKDSIVRQAPDYATAMKDYEAQQVLLRDITKALGSSDKVAKETAINKIMGAIKESPSAEFRRQLVSALETQGGVNVLPAVAGQELGQWMPSSGVGRTVAGGGLTAAYFLHHPELAAVLPFTSPRLMGEAYYGLGKTANAAQQVRNALRMTPEQQAYANALLMEAQQQPTNQNALAR